MNNFTKFDILHVGFLLLIIFYISLIASIIIAEKRVKVLYEEFEKDNVCVNKVNDTKYVSCEIVCMGEKNESGFNFNDNLLYYSLNISTS